MSRDSLRNATRRHQARLHILCHLLEHPCVDCGETDVRCLQFDHRDPSEKRAAVSVLAAKGITVMEIRKEILKCDVRCANCHAKRTAEQFSFYKADEDLIQEARDLCEELSEGGLP